MRTVSGCPLIAARAASGLATTYWPASTAPSAPPNASSVAGLRRLLAIGNDAFLAITSRGVHSASARRAGGPAIGASGAKMSCSMPADGESVPTYSSGRFRVPEEPAAISTTSYSPWLTRSWMSAPRGHTVILAVTGLAPHHLSLATRTTEPSLLTDSILKGPDDGNRLGSKSSELRFQVLFHTRAMRSTAGPSLLSSAVVMSMPSSSEMTCDGIIEVAPTNWPR